MSLPQSIDYSNLIRPRGVASSFKRWEVLPQTQYNQSYNMTEQVRFLFQTKDFIDPYQSYIEMEVEFDPADYDVNGISIYDVQAKDNVPSFHLDGSSTSLISEMILSSNMKEIERVQEYDQIGNLLNDMSVDLQCKQQKFIEGYGFDKNSQRHGINSEYSSQSSQAGSNNYSRGVLKQDALNFKMDDLDNNNGGFPFQMSSLLSQPFAMIQPITYLVNAANCEAFTTGSATTNFQQLNQSSEKILTSNRYTVNFFQFAKVNHSFERSQTSSQYGIQHTSGMSSGIYGHLNGSIPIPNGANFEHADFNNSAKCKNQGYIRQKSGGSMLNITDAIYPFYPVAQIINGKFVKDNIDSQLGFFKQSATQDMKNLCVTKKTYYIPILSSVIGALIPQDKWKLIPGEGLGELMFEFRFNRHAFFASGHKATLFQQSQQPLVPINISQNTWTVKWKVSKISMHFDLWDFGDVVRNQIRQNLQGEGIILSSQGFTQGPINTIANTQNVQNNWHINNGIPSLKNIWFWFLSNDYLKYSFCRKNFKFSHNLSEIQLKLGQQYVPQQPIRGNAGQLFKNGTFREDFTEFYVELQRVNGSFFTCDKMMGIAPEQFVLNERCYDPSDFYDTFGQQCIFHEERAKGQATYCIDLMYDPHDITTLSGIDTTQVKPFELMLKVNNDLIYPGSTDVTSTMYIFLHHDVMVQYRFGQVETAGWG